MGKGKEIRQQRTRNKFKSYIIKGGGGEVGVSQHNGHRPPKKLNNNEMPVDLLHHFLYYRITIDIFMKSVVLSVQPIFNVRHQHLREKKKDQS